LTQYKTIKLSKWFGLLNTGMSDIAGRFASSGGAGAVLTGGNFGREQLQDLWFLG